MLISSIFPGFSLVLWKNEFSKVFTPSFMLMSVVFYRDTRLWYFLAEHSSLKKLLGKKINQIFVESVWEYELDNITAK